MIRAWFPNVILREHFEFLTILLGLSIFSGFSVESFVVSPFLYSFLSCLSLKCLWLLPVWFVALAYVLSLFRLCDAIVLLEVDLST